MATSKRSPKKLSNEEVFTDLFKRAADGIATNLQDEKAEQNTSSLHPDNIRILSEQHPDNIQTTSEQHPKTILHTSDIHTSNIPTTSDILSTSDIHTVKSQKETYTKSLEQNDFLKDTVILSDRQYEIYSWFQAKGKNGLFSKPEIVRITSIPLPTVKDVVRILQQKNVIIIGKYCRVTRQTPYAVNQNIKVISKEKEYPHTYYKPTTSDIPSTSNIPTTSYIPTASPSYNKERKNIFNISFFSNFDSFRDAFPNISKIAQFNSLADLHNLFKRWETFKSTQSNSDIYTDDVFIENFSKIEHNLSVGFYEDKKITAAYIKTCLTNGCAIVEDTYMTDEEKLLQQKIDQQKKIKEKRNALINLEFENICEDEKYLPQFKRLIEKANVRNSEKYIQNGLSKIHLQQLFEVYKQHRKYIQSQE